MERRAEYVVACLAAMKAGGAYLILELAYPPPLPPMSWLMHEPAHRTHAGAARGASAGRDGDVRPG